MLTWITKKFRKKLNIGSKFNKGDWVRVYDTSDAPFLEPLPPYIGQVVNHDDGDWLVLIDRGSKTQYEEVSDLTLITEEEAMLHKLSN